MDIREFISKNIQFIRNSCNKYKVPGYLTRDDLAQEVCIKLIKYMDRDLEEQEYFKVTSSVIYSTLSTMARKLNRQGYQFNNTCSIDSDESFLQIPAPPPRKGKSLYTLIFKEYKDHRDFEIFKQIIHGYKFSEVGENFGMQTGTVKGKYFRLLKEIKKAYHERENFV